MSDPIIEVRIHFLATTADNQKPERTAYGWADVLAPLLCNVLLYSRNGPKAPESMSTLAMQLHGLRLRRLQIAASR
ncbi:hypothetical protein IE4771_PB00204 (plasmid) [Rhizobium etli bv. mimosae str. IE4771]|uniref:Uncharacterized protein n=1 Tax=Rhizobium etli bv. mimosae str. IE4771 TaxID=1432050 RepID=A0A060I862_RHIET|nr:hypothetical protein IE4771_PB00204 [Rhizobium sp. IE4771]